MNIHNLVYNTYFPIIINPHVSETEQIQKCHDDIDTIIKEYNSGIYQISHKADYLVLGILISYDKMIELNEEKHTFCQKVLMQYADWHFKNKKTNYMTMIDSIKTIIRNAIIYKNNKIESDLLLILNSYNKNENLNYANTSKIFMYVVAVFLSIYFIDSQKTLIINNASHYGSNIINWCSPMFSNFTNYLSSSYEVLANYSNTVINNDTHYHGILSLM